MFSILMSVYKEDVPRFFEEALDSVVNQSYMPAEIVLVLDGPLKTELNDIINSYSNNNKVKFIIAPLEKNMGLGLALAHGVKFCTQDYIVRMDSDDVSSLDRLSFLREKLTEYPESDVIGTYIEEFHSQPGDLFRRREVPLEYGDIKKFSKLRNPMNHVSVCFRSQFLKDVGSYVKQEQHEDYYLWIRCILMSGNLYNFPEVTVFVRVGNDMVGRRHGLTYFKYEVDFVRLLIDQNYLNLFEAFRYLIIRLPIRILPKRLLSIIYRFLRS